MDKDALLSKICPIMTKDINSPVYCMAECAMFYKWEGTSSEQAACLLWTGNDC